ncbi:MAG: GntR family transcriptional regulator [Planctomycetota bacterium]|nr:GntR family transcriptional regulator [Planctomycetota bacterium]
MDTVPSSANTQGPSGSRGGKLSYKFQRLRERIRQAIVSGELSGKLPGERELAKRFSANPKTMGKALTDLAAEGLLDRSIGRGTYVRGSEGEQKAAAGRWLILCDQPDQHCPVITHLVGAHADVEVGTVSAAVRPSYINQFSLVIDLAKSTPESVHRGLLIRGIPVLLVEKESGSFRMNSVLLDRAHAVADLTREMVLAGHRRILVVEQMLDGKASQIARMTAMRYSPNVQVKSCAVENIPSAVNGEAAAILCQWLVNPREVQELVVRHPHLASLSVAATGACVGEPTYTGVYITPAELAAAAMKMLEGVAKHRPTTLWLTGRYIDRGTIRVVPERQFSGDSGAEALSA